MHIIQNTQQYHRQYYQNNKNDLDMKNKLWSLEHPERIREIKQKSANKTECRNKQQLQQKRARLRWKLAVFIHYSNGDPHCNCCNENRIEFLSVDHLDNNGRQERKSKGYHSLYKYLLDNNFPVGYQILCMNCNFAKGKFGECPHSGELAYQS